MKEGIYFEEGDNDASTAPPPSETLINANICLNFVASTDLPKKGHNEGGE
jgi:hypothetical protein